MNEQTAQTTEEFPEQGKEIDFFRKRIPQRCKGPLTTGGDSKLCSLSRKPGKDAEKPDCPYLFGDWSINLGNDAYYLCTLHDLSLGRADMKVQTLDRKAY